ncbi:MAG: glycosyltransferase, partial [Actinomycetota bacterium]|nr:glycosyltransferase [Actinomycetota bacterium]
GLAWRMMPHDLPKWKTVYDYFRNWRIAGIWEQLNGSLRKQVRLNCRGSRPEAVVYAAALARHSAALVAHADAVIVPSPAALDRLTALRAPLGATPVHVVGHVVRALEGSPPPAPSLEGFALVAARLAPEKAVDVAIDACARAHVPLVIAGDGPERARLEACASGHDVRFTGRVEPEELAQLRTRAGVAVVTTRAHETFGLAALEAMAAGLPTVVTARGALSDLAEGAALVQPDAPELLASAIERARGNAEAGHRAHATALRLAAPAAVAPQLAAVYASL